jgi:hypothetical protein
MEDIQTLLNNAKQLTEDGNIKVNNLETSIVSPQPHRRPLFLGGGDPSFVHCTNRIV